MPELNMARWSLVGLLGISAVLFSAGGMALWIGVGLALLAIVLIAWHEWGPTITRGGLTIHQEGAFEHPDGDYPHGWVLVVHREDWEPLPEASLMVYTDSPILAHEAEVELPMIGREPSQNRVRIKGNQLRVPVHPKRCVDWIEEAVHLRVYSHKPIRTVYVRAYSRLDI